MKKKPVILATVLLVAVAAVVVPSLREIWLAVAYSEQPILWPGRAGLFLDHRNGAQYLRKRFAWIPGPVLIIRPRVCQSCSSSVHDRCLRRVRLARGVTMLEPAGATNEELAQALEDSPCTCLDPSHEWNR